MTQDDDGIEKRIEIEEETEIDLSDISWLDYIVLTIFWGLAFVVFLQFFTRYVLNNSLGWTEEIARFLLIVVTFTGTIMASRKGTHIAVEFLYRWVPRNIRRVAQFAIDAISTAFFAMMTFLCVQLAGRTNQLMVSIEVPKSVIYYYVAACFAGMTLYTAWNLLVHLRTGSSRLIDPEAYAGEQRTME